MIRHHNELMGPCFTYYTLSLGANTLHRIKFVQFGIDQGIISTPHYTLSVELFNPPIGANKIAYYE